MQSWHGGEYDQLVPFTGERRSLSFIHRTATDFLLDTVEGHGIMAHYSSSKSELATLLMNVWLARYCLLSYRFMPYDSAGSRRALPHRGNCLDRILQSLSEIRPEVQSSTSWDLRRCNQLISHCQRLSNAQRLYATSDGYRRARLCMGCDFLVAATAFSLTDCAHPALHKDNVDADTKFGILLTACQP